MSINKVVYGSKTLIDLTKDSVTATVLVEGYTAHDKAGNVITGTAKSEATMQAEIDATWEASY